jgi:transcription elongation factor Elf1
MELSGETKTFFDLLEKSIIDVICIETNKFVIGKFKIDEFKNKFSNLDNPIKTLFVNNLPLNGRKYKTKYLCDCGNTNTILLHKFLNKKKLICPKCRETEDKKRRHSELLRSKNFVKKEKIKQKLTIEQQIELSKINFNLENQIFKNNFFLKNITESEFNNVVKHISKVNGISINDEKIIFIPYLKTNNQSKYSQYIFIGDKKTLLNNVSFVCQNCNLEFPSTRRVKTKVMNKKILCKACSLSNKTFKIKKYINIYGDIITYQSQLEKKFIDECENIGIKVLNGNLIKYVHNNVNHTYRIDFYLPDFNYLIEIKGNHIWHRNQIKTGIWKSKQTSAEKFAKKNNNTYKLLFQEDIENFINLLRYSLDCNEIYRS